MYVLFVKTYNTQTLTKNLEIITTSMLYKNVKITIKNKLKTLIVRFTRHLLLWLTLLIKVKIVVDGKKVAKIKHQLWADSDNSNSTSKPRPPKFISFLLLLS